MKIKVNSRVVRLIDQLLKSDVEDNNNTDFKTKLNNHPPPTPNKHLNSSQIPNKPITNARLQKILLVLLKLAGNQPIGDEKLREAIEKLKETIQYSKKISEDLESTIEHSKEVIENSRNILSRVRKNKLEN